MGLNTHSSRDSNVTTMQYILQLNKLAEERDNDRAATTMYDSAMREAKRMPVRRNNFNK